MKELIRSGVNDIDFTHLVMVNIACRIERHLSKENWDMLNANLDAYITTTRNHFMDEERVLSAVGYTELKAHATEHYHFIENLFLFRDHCMKKIQIEILKAEFDVICTEMARHVNESDTHAAQFIVNQHRQEKAANDEDVQE